MKVCIYADNGILVWEHDPLGGVTADDYLRDGTQQQIIVTLIESLGEARGQLGRRVSLKVVDAVADIGTAAAEIDGCIPISAARDRNARR